MPAGRRHRHHAQRHVHLLPAGRLKVSPHRLLGNGAWKSLLEQVPGSYGYVIIDTPPVLAASEALVLAKGPMQPSFA